MAESPRRTSSLSEHSAACRLIQCLADQGVRLFFGIPGGPAAPIFEAIRVTAGVRLIESRQEASAVFAAAAYFRATRRVAAVVTTSGPGIANAAAGVISAHLEQTPVLILSGDVPWSSGQLLLQDSGPQGIAIEQLYAHAARRIERVHHERSVVPQCLAALDAASSPRAPGPAIVILPLDVAARSTAHQAGGSRKLLVRDEIAEADLRRALQLLCAAKTPLLVVGGACRAFAPAIQDLAEALQLPFVTTPRAKGTLSETHPLSLRNAGLAASLWAREYCQRGVDVCLALGTDLDDCSVGPTPLLAQQGALIHVDISAHVFGRNLPCALPITASADSFCAALKALWSRENERFPPPATAAVLHGIKRRPAFEQDYLERGRSSRVHPARALLALQAAWPKPLRAISDIGAHMLFAFHYLTIDERDRFDIQFNPGCMGSGIAGAIGLSLAEGETPVLCICGDGGMHMNGMEVLVAAKGRLPIVYAVFNDARYNIVHHGMKQLYGEAEPWDMPPVDFAAWARALGVAAAVVESEGELRRELLESLSQQYTRPCLLDIRIDPEVTLRGGGRVEALQQMGASGEAPAEDARRVCL